MSIFRRIVALPLLFASLLLGQALRLVPDIAVAEAEYRDAQEAWIQNDPTLEKDLYKAPPDQVRQRIHRAAQLADDAMVKKEAYFNLFIQRMEDMRAKLNDTQGPGIPTEALKKDLDEQQTRLLGDQDRLELLLHDLPPGDEYALVRRQLEGERAELISAQNNVAMRIRSLDNIGKAEQSTAGAGDLTAKLDEIVKVWQQERDSAVRQRPAWARLYQVMEDSLSKPAPPAAVAPKTTASAKAPSKGKAAATARPAAAAVPETGISGIWTYASQPGAWTGYGEPEMVKLVLHVDAAGAVRGVYSARLPVRNGVQDVELTLEGQASPTATSIQVHWRSQRPAAEGEMEIKAGADGRMLVARTQSNDSFIPRGTEVLLRH